MKATIEHSDVSIQAKGEGLAFRKSKIQTEVRIKLFNWKERRFIMVNKDHSFPLSFSYGTTILTTEGKITFWFRCNKKGVRK